MVSPAAKLVAGVVMRLSSPTAEPRSTVVTVRPVLEPVVSVSMPEVSVPAGGTSAVVSVAGGVVSAGVLSFLLQPASARPAKRIAAMAAFSALRFMGILLWGKGSGRRASGSGQPQYLARADQVGVFDLVAVGFEDVVPAARLRSEEHTSELQSR